MKPILVVQGVTAHPPNGYDIGREYPVQVLSAPICYAVRDSGAIKIVGIEVY
jgi:hypothetical protein